MEYSLPYSLITTLVAGAANLANRHGKQHIDLRYIDFEGYRSSNPEWIIESVSVRHRHPLTELGQYLLSLHYRHLAAMRGMAVDRLEDLPPRPYAYLGSSVRSVRLNVRVLGMLRRARMAYVNATTPVRNWQDSRADMFCQWLEDHIRETLVQEMFGFVKWSEPDDYEEAVRQAAWKGSVGRAMGPAIRRNESVS